MAQATNSTEGEIILSGDLTGDANAPELRASGVTPGVYSVAQRATIDSKGRIVSIGEANYSADIAPIIGDATTSVKGVFSLGTGVVAPSGVLDATLATSSVLGIASYGIGLVITDGEVTFDQSILPVATGSVFGLVKSSTNIDNTSGTLSVADATTSAKGVASFNSADFVVSSGVVSLLNKASLAAQNTWSASQSGAVDSSSPSSTFTPNFQTSAEVEDLTLTANLTINFPTTLAPTGTVVRKTLHLKYKPSSTTYTVTLNGSYATNKTLTFSNPSYTADVLHLICTDTVCYAILNEAFA